MQSRRRHPAISAAERRNARFRRLRPPRPPAPRAAIALFGSLALLFAVWLSSGSASAAPACKSSQKTNASGTVVYGGPCADQIVITSPLVETVYAGEGDDVVYATAGVEEIFAGEGDDVIYGEPPAEEAVGISYESESASAGEAGALASRLDGFRRFVKTTETATDEMQCSGACYGGDGNQEIFGGPGGDEIFGERGNDTLHGEGGPDKLYGGIGDDVAFGDDGTDLLSGGLGTDTLDGKEGNDTVRGEGTVDVLRDSGSKSDTDTISFATAVTPGFHGFIPARGFPADADGEERGVEVRLDGAPAGCGVQSCNNDARYGGGGDEISVAGFENVFGSPFADRIVGSSAANRIDGGGGADVIEGGGGDDRLFGGADGDYISGGAGKDTTYFEEAAGNSCAPDVETRFGCTGSGEEVQQRDRSKIEVGYISPPVGGTGSNALYMVGSEASDLVDVKAAFGGLGGQAIFTARPGSASFDTGPTAASPNCNYKPNEVKCVMPVKIDAITVAGMAGDDAINLATDGSVWLPTVTTVLLGGSGNDVLNGSGQTEDMLVDGPGNDSLSGFGFDDALLNNEGFDQLQGGQGSDLLVSSTTCEGDILQGADSKGDEGSVNNASWAQLPAYAGGVVADLSKQTAGGQLVEEEVILKSSFGRSVRPLAKPEGQSGHGGKVARPACGSGSLDHLRNIDDLEGSSQEDVFFGDSRANNLLGRNGKDLLYARAGDDRISAQDGEHDEIGGGGGKDVCAFDKGVDSVEQCDS
jgi:Ca2+-binding RTX toxin-like protein